MLINKRECRKYADSGQTMNRNGGLLYAEQVDHIVRTALKNIGGHRILVLYFYNREKAANGYCKPIYTLFQAKDDYTTLEQTEDGKSRWLSANLYHFGEGRFVKKCAFYSPKDVQRVTRFCGIPTRSGLSALEVMQNSIMSNRLDERIKARERKILKRMKSISSVPRDFKGWIHREVLPAYIFYKYHRSKKPLSGYCSACCHDVLVTGAKHNEAGKCPRCKKAITFKAVGKSQRLWDRTTVQLLQKTGPNELLVRIFKTSKSYRNIRTPDLSVWENARIYLRRNGEKLVVEPYYYSYTGGILTKWKKGERPVFNRWSYNFEHETCGMLYCRNLVETLRNTPWQYCQLEQFYRMDYEPLEVIPYLRAYSRYPMIEYLVKFGLGRITAYVVYSGNVDPKVINANGKNIREILGVGPEDIPVLRAVNANESQLKLYRALKQRCARFDEELLRWFADHKIPSIDNVVYPLQFMTGQKLMHYVGQQYTKMINVKSSSGYRRYESLNPVLSEYKDYLRFSQKLEYDLSDSFVLFPRNLKKAHDQASNLYDTHKSEIFDKLIQSAYPSLLERYQFTKNGLTLLPPKTAEEIVTEGHTLHHCVHSYVEKVADRECVILFLRRTDHINDPFYTVELQDDQIIQTRGQGNCAPTPEIKRYLSMWKERKLKKLNGQKAA